MPPLVFPPTPAAGWQLAGLGRPRAAGTRRLACLPSPCGMPQAGPCQRRLAACRSREAGVWDACQPGSERCMLCPALPACSRAPLCCSHSCTELPSLISGIKVYIGIGFVSEAPAASTPLCHVFQPLYVYILNFKMV